MATSVVSIKLNTVKLDRLVHEVGRRAEQVLDLAASRIEKGAKRRARVDTGALKNSIGWRRAGRFTRVISDGVEYGATVELGSKPHIIRPRFKKALAFMINGRRIVRRQVFHPGTKPYPFLRPAVEAERPYLVAAWRELFRP